MPPELPAARSTACEPRPSPTRAVEHWYGWPQVGLHWSANSSRHGPVRTASSSRPAAFIESNTRERSRPRPPPGYRPTDGQRRPAVGHSVQCRNGGLAVRLGVHLDERGARAVPRLERFEYRNGTDRAVGGEQPLELVARDCGTYVRNVQRSRHDGSFTRRRRCARRQEWIGTASVLTTGGRRSGRRSAQRQEE